MIPIRDMNPTRRRPVVTYALIAINLVVFLGEYALGSDSMQRITYRFGVVPNMLLHSGHPGSWVTPLTSMFMHGGWLHVLGNMWFLHVFGDNVEDALGRVRYLLFYFACGLAAVAAQVAIDPYSQVPMVGASGAIAGVLAGYVMLFPRQRVLTLVPIFFIFFVEIPAVFFIFVWFGYQLLMGFTAIGSLDRNMGGVAFFAHIGGFLAGLLLVRLLRQKANPTGGFQRPRLDHAHSDYPDYY